MCNIEISRCPSLKHSNRYESQSVDNSKTVSASPNVIESMKVAKNAFMNNHGSTSFGSRQWFYSFEQSPYRFIGIHKDQQTSLLEHCLKYKAYRPLHTFVMKTLGLPTHTPTLQVIGDSALFSVTGTKTAKVFLETILKKHPGLVLWGYTGNIDRSTNTADTNQLVSQWLDSDPRRYKRALANVVDFHTVKAVEEWKCSIPFDNLNFYMVYGHAEFGDDVISSDVLTDRAVVLEGGIQSFLQMVNMLSFKVKMQCLYNIRGRVARIDGKNKKFFSASEFCHILFKNTVGKSLSKEQVEKCLENYLMDHVLFDVKKPDASTKQKLFDLAWNKFINEKLWTRLNLCHFTRAV